MHSFSIIMGHGNVINIINQVNDIYHISIAHNYRKAMQTCKIYNYYFIFATEKTKAIKSKKLKF